MTPVSKSEYVEWRTSVVTRQLFDSIRMRIEDGKETLANVAGLNALDDVKIVQLIATYREILDWEPDFIEEKHD